MSDSEKTYDYVIVGAGVAAASAVKGIRSTDSNGSIGVFGSEPDKPVYRPVLTKDLWLKDEATLEGSSLAGDLDDDEGVDRLRSRYLGCCRTVGRQVRVELPDGTVTGEAVDVTDEGHLVVELLEGGRRVVAAGDVVHLRPVDP